ncbi:unnamed protein product, partial [Effrenium voratum]
ERERKRDFAWDARWTASDDDGQKPTKNEDAVEEAPPSRNPREVISAHPSGHRACKWARKWRSAMAAVLPSGLDEAVPLTDTEVRKLGLLLWKDVVSWVQRTDANRYLGLFRADHQNAKTFGWDGKEMPSRGLEPGRVPPEWSFVPVTDLFLLVGEGLVGITTEGIFADKTKGQGRRSLKECYKKCRSQTCFQPARCLGNTWNPRHAQDAPFRTRRSGDANASWRLADEFGCGEAPSQHETQRGSFDPIQMTHWHHVGPVGEHVGPPSFPKLFRNKRIHT